MPGVAVGGPACDPVCDPACDPVCDVPGRSVGRQRPSREVSCIRADCYDNGPNVFGHPMVYLNEDAFELSLPLVEAGKVVPIVGPDVIADGKGPSTITLSNVIAARLNVERDVKPRSRGLISLADPSLAHASLAYSPLAYTLARHVLRDGAFEASAVSGALAPVRILAVFDTHAFDSLLTQAVNEACDRDKRRMPEQRP